MAGDTIKFLIEMRDGASGPLKKVGKAADQSGKDAKTATTKYTELSSKLHLLGVAAKAVRGAVLAVVKPMKMLAVGGVEAGAQMEGFETRLKVLMGSSAAAKDRLDKLFQIGTTTPFQLPGLIEAEVNLRALGVNAEETLPLVMDFAGAMGVDVARAAVEVGRAMQFGAGAVETIAGRALRAQVELRTGGDALKMSTEEFREAMVATLTDKDGIFKGGTDELAKTFDGMVSNLQDSWFKFQKEIGDAGAFAVAKEILASVLSILSDSEAVTKRWAKMIAQGIVKGMILALGTMGRILETSNEFSKSWTLSGVAIDQLIIKSEKLNRSIKSAILSAGEFTGMMSDETMLRMQKQIVDSYKESGAARDRIDKAMFEELDALEAEGVKIRKIRQEADRISANIESIIAGKKSTEKGGARAEPARAVEDAISASKETGPTSQELEDSMREALEGTEAALKEALISLQDLQYKLSPAGLAEGLVNKLTSAFSTLTAMMGPAGGLIQGLSIMGKEGAGKITKQFKESIQGVVVGISEVLPQLIVSIPRALINAVPDIVEGFLVAIPALLKAFLYELPKAIVIGMGRWFEIVWETVISWFFPNKQKRKERRERRSEAADDWMRGDVGVALRKFFNIDKKHAGTSHIDRSGAFLLQQGEAVVPNSGTTTQGMARRMGGRGGMNVTINTNVVDQNSIRGLGKLLEQEFSSFGRSTSPVFNSPTGSTG